MLLHTTAIQCGENLLTMLCKLTSFNFRKTENLIRPFPKNQPSDLAQHQSSAYLGHNLADTIADNLIQLYGF